MLFQAGAEVITPDVYLVIISIHVGSGDYEFNIKEVFDLVEPKVKSHRFVAGGVLNAARHLDDVYGRQWNHRFFNSITERGFHDCHSVVHGMEVQSFWGAQAREPDQDDPMLIDVDHASTVIDCKVIDNTILRELCDQGPLYIINTDA
jgi:hypothetical protein